MKNITENPSNEIIDLLNDNTLPNEDLQIVSALCGFDVAKKLLTNIPGMVINIPVNPLRKVIEQYILNNYDGTKASIANIIVACHVTEKHVYNVIKRCKNPNIIKADIK